MNGLTIEEGIKLHEIASRQLRKMGKETTIFGGPDAGALAADVVKEFQDFLSVGLLTQPNQKEE